MALAREARVRVYMAVAALALLGARGGLAGADDSSLRLAGDPTSVAGTLAILAVSEDQQRQDLNGDGDMDDRVVHVFDARTRTTRNLGLVAISHPPVVQSGSVFVTADEGSVDLNGDGDEDDSVLHVFDARSGELRNLRLAVGDLPDPRSQNGRRLPFVVFEPSQGGSDLNGDGDGNDGVVHYFELRSGEVVNTGLAVQFSSITDADPIPAGRLLVLSISERAQASTDLNGDGDVEDEVIQLFDTSLRRARNVGLSGDGGVAAGMLVLSVSERDQGVDLNGDGDTGERVLHLVDLRSGDARNLRLAASIFPASLDRVTGLVAFSVFERDQGNLDATGDGDSDDAPVHVLDVRSGAVRSLGLSALVQGVAPGGRAVLLVREEDDGRDLNGDGDSDDFVLHVADLRRSRVVNTRTAFVAGLVSPRFAREFFPFLVRENGQGSDLNGDGDGFDAVLHVVSLRTGETLNSGLDATATGFPLLTGAAGVDGARIVLPVSEQAQGGADLNGDGDAGDVVLHLFDARARSATNLRLPIRILTSDLGFPSLPLVFDGDGFVSVPVPESDGSVDLNGDGDVLDDVLHLVDIRSGTIANARRAVPGRIGFVGVELRFGRSVEFPVESPREGGAFTFLVSEADDGHVDLNGDGDTADVVLHGVRLRDRDRDRRFDFADERIGRRGR